MDWGKEGNTLNTCLVTALSSVKNFGSNSTGNKECHTRTNSVSVYTRRCNVMRTWCKWPRRRHFMSRTWPTTSTCAIKLPTKLKRVSATVNSF